MADKVTNADIMNLLKNEISKDIKELKSDLADIRSDISHMDRRVERLEKADDTLLEKYNDALKQHEIQALVSEYNSKEYNIIIYNIPGAGKNEKPIASHKKVVETLEKCLEMYDAENINIRNAHRLPGKKGKRLPLIFKVSTMFEKHKIWENIANLKDFNEGKADEEKVYIEMNHLPKKLKADKDSLLDDYYKAKEDGKNPKWRFFKKAGEYGYRIGDKSFRPKCNNFVRVTRDQAA